jgi:hypothetical protein
MEGTNAETLSDEVATLNGTLSPIGRDIPPNPGVVTAGPGFITANEFRGVTASTGFIETQRGVLGVINAVTALVKKFRRTSSFTTRTRFASSEKLS